MVLIYRRAQRRARNEKELNAQLESGVLAALRAATRTWHARIEASPSMVRLLSDDYTTAEHEAHLGRLLGFYEPFEESLAAAGARAAWPESPNRSAQLKHDLQALGVSAAGLAALPRCPDLAVAAELSLAGCLYVYEGASLGGQVVARHLRHSLGPANAFAFYHIDGASRARQWKAFCGALERTGAAEPEAACAAAVAVFRALGDWMDR